MHGAEINYFNHLIVNDEGKQRMNTYLHIIDNLLKNASQNGTITFHISFHFTKTWKFSAKFVDTYDLATMGKKIKN